MKYLFYSLRPKQWIKNLFIFLPLIFGKKLFVSPANLKTVIAFCLFSLAAGVVYIVNDIIDIEQDKLHPLKCLRPIASGKISIRRAQIAAWILGVFIHCFIFRIEFYFWIGSNRLYYLQFPVFKDIENGRYH
ncbi:MAG: UbiA family prenyltransferase [Candidatus Omnitrophica bacterium]|nr:UbiA family prenyltransferase [Candidatus Omnitrophota bacterium]